MAVKISLGGVLSDESPVQEAARLAAQAAYNDVPPAPGDVRAEAAKRLDAIAAAYTPQERETWSTQVKEAIAFQADASATVPMLTAIAAGRGVGVAALAATVIANETAFSAAAGVILGVQGDLLARSPIPADFRNDSYWSAS